MKTENLILSIVIAFLAVFVISLLSGMMSYNSYGIGMMGNFFGGFGFMWLFGWLFMILILVALVLFIIWMVKQLQPPQQSRRR